MHDRVDRPERGTRGGHEFGGGAFPGEVTGPPLDLGAGPLAFGGHRFQSLEAGRVSALSMQHQALTICRQSPRDRGADPGSSSGDD